MYAWSLQGREEKTGVIGIGRKQDADDLAHTGDGDMDDVIEPTAIEAEAVPLLARGSAVWEALGLFVTAAEGEADDVRDCAGGLALGLELAAPLLLPVAAMLRDGVVEGLAGAGDDDALCDAEALPLLLPLWDVVRGPEGDWEGELDPEAGLPFCVEEADDVTV